MQPLYSKNYIGSKHLIRFATLSTFPSRGRLDEVSSSPKNLLRYYPFSLRRGRCPHRLASKRTPLPAGAWPLCVKGAVTTMVVTGGLLPSGGQRLSKYLCDNPSATADGVPPPFTHGRLWFSYVFEKVVGCLQTHIFSFLSLSLAGIASARKHWVSSLISRCGIPTNSRSICTIISSGSRIRRQRSNG